MATGRLSAAELTRAYLQRIERLDPLLHAVIETNPQALDIAARRDAERRAGRTRGPLHGIPVLVKDNIATNDAMETTAGSLALVGSRVPRDARIVRRLRDVRRRHPRQGEPVRVGQFPRPRPACGQRRRPVPQRLERARRLHAQSVWPGLGPVRFELRLGRGPGRQPVRGSHRERDRRLDHLPVGGQRDRRTEADGRPCRPGRDRPHLAQSGHGRADGANGDRRGHHPRRPAVAVRRGAGPASATGLPPLPPAGRAPGRPDRRRSARVRRRLRRCRAQRRRRASLHHDDLPRGDARRPRRSARDRRDPGRRDDCPADRVQGRHRGLPRRPAPDVDAHAGRPHRIQRRPLRGRAALTSARSCSTWPRRRPGSTTPPIVRHGRCASRSPEPAGSIASWPPGDSTPSWRPATAIRRRRPWPAIRASRSRPGSARTDGREASASSPASSKNPGSLALAYSLEQAVGPRPVPRFLGDAAAVRRPTPGSVPRPPHSADARPGPTFPPTRSASTDPDRADGPTDDRYSGASAGGRVGGLRVQPPAQGRTPTADEEPEMSLTNAHVRARSIAILIATMVGAPVAAAAPPSSAACDSRVNNTQQKLLECVTLAGVREHQAALQAIADANGGTRLPARPATTQRRLRRREDDGSRLQRHAQTRSRSSSSRRRC